MGEYITRIRKFYRFTKLEVKNVIIIILAFSLIAGFNDGAETFDPTHWIANYIVMLLIVAVGVFVHHQLHHRCVHSATTGSGR